MLGHQHQHEWMVHLFFFCATMTHWFFSNLFFFNRFYHANIITLRKQQLFPFELWSIASAEYVAKSFRSFFMAVITFEMSFQYHHLCSAEITSICKMYIKQSRVSPRPKTNTSHLNACRCAYNRLHARLQNIAFDFLCGSIYYISYRVWTAHLCVCSCVVYKRCYH